MISNFVSNNIGVIIDILKPSHALGKYPYIIAYDNIPNGIKSDFSGGSRHFSIDELLYYSKDRNELEHIIDANKFNL